MNKSAVSVIAVIGLGIVGLPPVLGTLSESQVRSRVAAISDSGYVELELQSFERGWFTSVASMELRLGPAYIEQLSAIGLASDSAAVTEFIDQRITILLEIAHGPIAISDGVHFGFADFVARPDPDAENNIALQERLGMPYLFDFRGQTGFLGTLRFDVEIPPIDYANDDSELIFSGLEVSGSIAGRQVQTSADIGSLRYSIGPISVLLEGISTAGDNSLLTPYILLGSFQMLIERIVIASPLLADDAIFDATKVSLGSNVSLNDDRSLLHGDFSYRAQDVQTANGLAIANGELRMSMNNLDVVALQDYYAFAQNITNTGSGDPDQILAQILPVVQRLLAAGPSVAIEPIAFTLDDEPFEGRIHLETDVSALPPVDTINLQNPALWIGALAATADIKLSKLLAGNLAARVSATQLGANSGQMDQDELERMAEAQASLVLVTLSAQGILADDGDSYTTHVEYVDGALSVNGAALPFLGLR